ncbi:MAG: tRNA threonylcarbamoyladenosine dehydratase, partial [Selenomonadaceae bacterium]|nr:tRNA threonylcarbamoyladenosine dehydratase [Selenomonadaceae bacterium]
SVDPVAKISRKKLRERGIKNLRVVWSDEMPRPVENFIGSTAFVPSTAGLILASEVVRDLLSE